MYQLYFQYIQVYQRLQRLNLTVSHSSMIRIVDIFGKNHDSKLKQWRDGVVDETDKIVSQHYFLSRQYFDFTT